VKIKLDENLPASARLVLTEFGHDVETVVDEGLGGRDDATVLAAANAEERLLFTLDRGFGDLRAYPPGSHCGIVVLRPDSQAESSVLATLSSLAAHHDIEALGGCTVVVHRHLVRIRRPL
jgi:predicted nuclease of predicted toxin-antitoxin system